ncbi:hypothetical protein FEM33_01540 [Dyadobacter flavalbus]|uniref:Phage head morphogenesis domain-containing protein n=1 Tax=Dyadobacter flavalbus TaxID=2579942 RepID=A0A5M8R3R9_9BACT|nr:hypothetical protein [Dyadobacter flavalbus]KAA6441443.1 hypothetical protein FEM33_01540 [Dyadobacter flavalbus]
MPKRPFDHTTYDRKHFETITQYVKRIKRIYARTIRDAVLISQNIRLADGQLFSFEANQVLKQQADLLFQAMYTEMLKTINAGTNEVWLISALKNDDLVKSVLDTTKLSESVLSRYLNRNLSALSAFQNRKVGGMGLSERIWKQTQQFRSELEFGLDIGIGEGKSAAALARDLQQNMIDPDRLFRRVRDKHGNLVLSKAAKNFNPGQGVYRSSYKNALRLTRTEINMSYRTADYERFQQLDFVVGYEVKRSNNLTTCDVCGPLAGKYPKTFRFIGWHSNCRCFVVSILATNKVMNELELKLLNDEPTADFKSSNEVKNVHPGYLKWIKENNSRILRAKSVPYFIRDNPQYSGLRIG